MRKRWLSFALCLCLTGSVLLSGEGVGRNEIAKAAANKVQQESILKEEKEAVDSQETEVEEGKVTDLSAYKTNEVLIAYKTEEAGGLKLSQVKRDVKEDLPDHVQEETLTEDYSLIKVESREDLSETLEALSENENVAYVQPNYEYTLASSIFDTGGTAFTSDAYSKYQWAYNGVYNIQMAESWDLGVGANQKVIVAVMDTGVNYRHEDLKDAMWVNSGEIAGNGKDDDGNGYIDDINGWNFADNSSAICKKAKDGSSYTDNHGTHIAGIIAATADNSLGIAGIASKNDVKVMSVKVFPDKGNTRTSDIIKGIGYAEENGATVCNMSFITASYDKLMEKAMANSSMLFVCAAGNGEKWSFYNGYNIDSHPIYPADFNLTNKITVANMNVQGKIDKSSCYGSKMVDIAAPGTQILSSIVAEEKGSLEAYAYYTGTSMASPMVTGTAALVSSFCGGLTAEQMKEAILQGAVTSTLFEDKVNSNRMLSAYGALAYYKDKMTATVKVSKISKSNHKKVTVSVVSPSSEITEVRYAYGNLSASDFASSDQSTLSLNSNTASFTAEKSGVYSIYCKNAAGQEVVKKANVTVKNLASLKLSSNAKVLKKGKTYVLKATVGPSGVYSKVTYKSSKKSVASVSSSGKVTAKKAGTATITVKATDGDVTITKKCRITVKNK